MPGIGIITNPHSKLNKRFPERQKLLGYIVGEHGKLELTNSLDDLSTAAEKFRDRDIEVLGINGGDGTINRTLTAIIRAYGSQKPLPKILILRGGTINVLAENIGVSGSPEAILVRYIESLSGLRLSRVEEYKTLRVGNHYGFLFGNGMVANYLSEFYKNKTGPLGAVWLVIKIHFWFLWNRKRYFDIVKDRGFEIVLNNELSTKQTERNVAMMASTVERMPLGPRLFPLARMSKDQFQFFSLSFSANSVVWRLPFAFFSNKEGQAFGKTSKLVSSLSLTTTDHEPQMYTLDGELFTAQDGKLEISLGPSVQLIVV
jgi:diacylglycerol kinase (ATP)